MGWGCGRAGGRRGVTYDVVRDSGERGTGFILEFTNKVHGNLGHDKVQSYFVNSFPSTITILVNLVSTESYDQEESNGAGCKEFGGELIEDVGFYRRIN